MIVWGQRRLAAIIAMLVFCVMLSCATKTPELIIVDVVDEPVYHLPEAGRMYIYDSNGIVAFDTSIEPDLINSGSFILPQNFFMDGVLMFQSGKRLYTYSMEKTRVLVERNDNGKPTINKEDVTKVYASDIIEGLPVDIKYSSQYKKGYDSAISWGMILDVQLQDNNMLDCGLFAEVNSEISLPPMDVFLANNKGAMISVGRLRIAPQKIDSIKMETASVPYQIMYEWDAGDVGNPYEYIRFENPFVTKTDTVNLRLNRNGVRIKNNAIDLISGKPIKIRRRDRSGIKTNRSIVVLEHKERADLPFTHSLRFTAQNTLSEKITLDISIPVTYSAEHKTQYHFTKEPDARPGDRMVWRFELENEETAVVEFTFDTNIKDVYMYHQYDYSDGGR